MQNDARITLEFSRIIDMLCEHALSERARDTLRQMRPLLSERVCQRHMRETTAARRMLDACGSPPLPTMKGLDEVVALCEADAMLLPEQLHRMAQFAASCKRTKSYLKRSQQADEGLAAWGAGIEPLDALHEEIERCVRGDELCSEASPALRDIRRRMESCAAQIKEKLGQILQSRRKMLADSYISQRGGRYVLPVKKEYRTQFGGQVVEVSGKGGTLFMEPSAIAKLAAQLTELEIQEDGEVRRILYTLTAMVAEALPAIRRNGEMMERLDVLFAKAKLSAAMDAREVAVGAQRRVCIRAGRHPLLERESCVPLDFELGDGVNGVIITGPNTGGKTVAVKTVGLLSMMAQCGLHIPCGEGSSIAMHDGYWCDIGDAQSITQNLSTFSGHMTNVIAILRGASRDSLVLLDELGSGTDPAEGMGIAIAVLEELRARGCLFLVTTHYPEVKDYAARTDQVRSARMAFDRDSLQPLYRLEMGKSGKSCALHIAARLGLPDALIARAQREADRAAPAKTAGMAVEPADIPAPAFRAPKSALERYVEPKPDAGVERKFTIGDSVTLPGGELGIVCRPADEQGQVVVQVKGEKRHVSHTRLKLKVSAADLYPPDYDFSILFDSVEVRKARHKMGKRHDPSLEIALDPEA